MYANDTTLNNIFKCFAKSISLEMTQVIFDTITIVLVSQLFAVVEITNNNYNNKLGFIFTF